MSSRTLRPLFGKLLGPSPPLVLMPAVEIAGGGGRNFLPPAEAAEAEVSPDPGLGEDAPWELVLLVSPRRDAPAPTSSPVGEDVDAAGDSKVVVAAALPATAVGAGDMRARSEKPHNGCCAGRRAPAWAPSA